MKNFSLSLTALSLVCFASGCGAMKNMEDMKSTTEKMNQTTTGMDGKMATMNGTMDDMSATTSGMSGTTQKMYQGVSFTYSDLRIGNTRDARQHALDAIEKSDDQVAKLGYASEYFAAMEYQFWKPDMETTQDRLDLQNVAVKDFFHKVKEYVSDHDALDPSASDAKSQNLFALAATLHYVNLAQVNGLKQTTGQPVVTMLSMIEDGLKAKADLEAGRVSETTLPEYAAEVLRNEQDAIYILRVRQNFLKAIALSLASSKPNGDDKARSAEFLTYLGGDLFNTKWKPNFDSRNAAQINYMSTVLEYATADLEFMKGQGIDGKSDAKIKLLLAHMKLDGLSRTEPAQDKALNRFATALGTVLGY